MSSLYRVQATIWVEAESGVEAADVVFGELNDLVGLDNALRAAEVMKDGEFVEEIG